MAFAAWDVATLFISYNLTYVARIGRWEGVNLGLLVVATTWLGVSYIIGRYSPEERSDKNLGYANLIKTSIAAGSVMAVFIGHSWVFQVADAQTRFRGFLIPFLVVAWALSTAGQIAHQTLKRKQQSWVILASQSETTTIKREIANEDKALQRHTKLLEKEKAHGCGMNLVNGSSAGLAIGSMEGMNGSIVSEVLRLREKGKRVIPLVSWCEQELQRIPPEMVNMEWLIQAEGFGLRRGSINWRVKRFGDILGALMAIISTSPIVVLAAILIWLEDGGPVLFQQIRSGLYGRPIRIWKLRSMKVNAERSGAQWATKGDTRVTKVGKVLRSTRIDELPQLFSVLNGDLSLIGPRPERPEIEKTLEEAIPNYRIRHWIRPGLSGWAQVCYPYGASISDSRMKLSYDLYYLRNASMLLDILITLKTIRLVLNAAGASPRDQMSSS